MFSEEAAARGITDTLAGKGLLSFDYDRDGDLDLFITNNGKQPILYRNDCANGNSWLQIQTEGTTSNRDGLGAFITVTPDSTQPSEIIVHEMNGGNNMISQNEKIAHFGLGSHQVVAQLTVKWPSGVMQSLTDVVVNQRLTLLEPSVFSANGLEPDSLLDAWEQAHFGHLDAKPFEDADGDGQSNAEEMIAGTNPLDASEFFQAQLTNDSAMSNKLSLVWEAKAGRQYRLEQASFGNINQWEAIFLQKSEEDSLKNEEIVIDSERGFFRMAVGSPSLDDLGGEL